MKTNMEEISNVPFYDDGKWKENVCTFKERFFQCEVCFENDKKFLMHANELGINYFIEQINSLNLKNENEYKVFTINQDIDEKRIQKVVGPTWKMDSLETDPDDLCANYNGYVYEGKHELINRHSKIKGFPAKRLEICWYPENKRIIGASINYKEWAIKIHISPQGLDDLMKILDMYKNVYYNFKIFYPSHVFVQKYGLSPYSLTDIPNLPDDEEHLVFIGFRKEANLENFLLFRGPVDLNIHTNLQEQEEKKIKAELDKNRISFEDGIGGVVLKNEEDLKAFLAGPSPEKQAELAKKYANRRFGDEKYNLLELCASPSGLLELEGILKKCIDQFENTNFIDFKLSKIDDEFLDKVSKLSIEDPVNKRIQYFNKVRFVFLNEPDAYILSLEYDLKNGILYTFTSFPQLLHLLDQVLFTILGGEKFKYSEQGWWCDPPHGSYKYSKITNKLSNKKFSPSSFIKFDIFDLVSSPFDPIMAFNNKLHKMFLYQPYEDDSFQKILTFNGYKNFYPLYNFIY